MSPTQSITISLARIICLCYISGLAKVEYYHVVLGCQSIAVYMSAIDKYLHSLSRLRRSFKFLSRLIMNSSPPNIPFIFETPGNTYEVSAWATHITATDPSTFGSCAVTCVEHRKDTSAKAHEYLHVTVTHTSGWETIIVVERCIDLANLPI